MNPRFSIIIPTYNRGHLLQYALKSVVNQNHDSFEIIVSDDHSIDNTKTVIAEIGSDKVRHVLTPKRMSMADHFEWASEQATGDYVMFLCDDDVLSPNTLTLVDKAISETNAQVIALNSGVYVFPEWNQGSGQNKLSFSLFSPDFIKWDSTQVLEGLFNLSPNYTTPRGNNSFCHRDIISAVRTKNGRFFLHPAPDMSSCIAVLGVVPFYTFIGFPLHIWGVSPESIGAIQEAKGGETDEKSKEAFGRAAIFELSPFRTYCPANIWAESMLQVKKISPDEYPELNYTNLYLECFNHLIELKNKGYSVSEELADLELSKEKLGISTNVASKKNRIKNRMLSSPFGEVLVKIKHTISPPRIPMRKVKKVVIDGKDGNFSNILECVEKLDGFVEANSSARPKQV